MAASTMRFGSALDSRIASMPWLTIASASASVVGSPAQSGKHNVSSSNDTTRMRGSIVEDAQGEDAGGKQGRPEKEYPHGPEGCRQGSAVCPRVGQGEATVACRNSPIKPSTNPAKVRESA